MIITCPSCQTRYTVKAQAFMPSGRKVRCASCGHSWHQDAPIDQPLAVTPEPEPVPAARAEPASFAAEVAHTATAQPAPAAPRAARMRRQGAGWETAAGWVVLVAVIGGLFGSLFAYREAVVTLWPNANALYAVVGMPVNTRGLEFRDITWARETEDGKPVLAIFGEVVNLTERQLSVPKVRVALQDAAGNEIYHWTFDVQPAQVGPREAINFVTRMESPPQEADALEVRFATADH